MKKPGELDLAGQIRYKHWRKGRLLSIAGTAGMILWGISMAFQIGREYVRIRKVATQEVFSGRTDLGTGVVLNAPADSATTASTLVGYQPVTDAATVEAFYAAVKAWKEALGGTLPISYPRLVQSDTAGFCAFQQAIAYAESSPQNRIVVCRFWNHDPETVFLHEVGHLLGVPHIEGDQLMNSAASDFVLRQPSRHAVAIARENMAK